MKYLNKIILFIVSVFFIMTCLISTSHLTIIVPINEYKHIEIVNNEVILYNLGQKIDSYKLKEKLFDYTYADVDGNDSKELIILTKGIMNRFGKEIIILKLESEILEVYREDYSDLKPWKVTSGDVDGDEKDEISIGVYKKTPLHQVMAKRPFIYYYEDNRLLPKWRGSRLSKPFDDYDFYDIDGDGIDELISIELLQNGQKVINTYKWRGFGFEGFLQSESYDNIKDLIVGDTSVFMTIEEKERDYQGLIKLEEDILKIERMNNE